MWQSDPRRATGGIPVRHTVCLVQAVGGAALTMDNKGSLTVIEAEPRPAPLGDGTARRRAVIALAAVALGAVILDLITKQLVTAHLEGKDPVRWLGGAVYLSVTRNGGAAFSLGKGYTFIFPVIATAVAVWIG